jgi:hypothetical protein
MRKVVSILPTLLLLVAFASAEIKTIDITIFGMD